MSDTDLQQYNGTPQWVDTADFETPADIYLVPTDGTVVSADSNLAGDTPVNRALRLIKDKVDGLRQAIIGDVGPTRRTIYSLRVDGTGGQVNAVSGGEISADNEIRTALGDFRASLGRLLLQDSAAYAQVGEPPAGYLRLFSTALQWFLTGMGPADANPPQGTAVPNRLTAKAVVKHYMVVASQAGVVNLFDGLGDWTVSIVDTGMASPARYRFRFLLPTAFADALYAPIVQWQGPNTNANQAMPIVMLDTLAPGLFDVALYDWGLGQFANLNIIDARIAVIACGQQNT